jgi:hypothetical protein
MLWLFQPGIVVIIEWGNIDKKTFMESIPLWQIELGMMDDIDFESELRGEIKYVSSFFLSLCLV